MIKIMIRIKILCVIPKTSFHIQIGNICESYEFVCNSENIFPNSKVVISLKTIPKLIWISKTLFHIQKTLSLKTMN